MKNTKKIVALLVAFALLFSFGVTAFASSKDPYATGDKRGSAYTDTSSQTLAIQEAIYGLTALGVLDGDGLGTTYRTTDTLTRAEFAKIVYYFAGFAAGDLTYFESLTASFPDTKSGSGYGWAVGYINACAKYGYFIGYEDGNFRPGNVVTMEEVVTVLLRILGYTDDLPGNWPADYNQKAVNIGITEYVSYVGGAPAQRGAVASLAYQSLWKNMVVYVKDATAAGVGYALGTVDADGYAATTFYTNQNTTGTYTLGAYTFNATRLTGVRYTAETLTAGKLVEAGGWGVTNAATGQLALYYGVSTTATTTDGAGTTTTTVYTLSADGTTLTAVTTTTSSAGTTTTTTTYPGTSAALASTYYLVGGELTDLGGTTGNVLLKTTGTTTEAIMATTNGRSTSYKNSANGTKWYDMASSYTSAALSASGLGTSLYYDSTASNAFGIFKESSVARVTSAVTLSFMNSDLDSIVIASADLAKNLFYNMSTGMFISYTELVKGDVIYSAGTLDGAAGANLYLVYNASTGAFTKLTTSLATVAGKDYGYTGAYLSVDNGATIRNFSYSYVAQQLNVSLTATTGTYVATYSGNKLCYYFTVGQDAIYTGIATSTALSGGNYAITMLDGTIYNVATTANEGARTLREAGVPSYISYRLNANNEISEIYVIANQTELNEGVFDGLRTGLTMRTGTLRQEDLGSTWVTIGGTTVNITDATVVYDFSGLTGNHVPGVRTFSQIPYGTRMVYIYNADTRELVYAFIMDYYSYTLNGTTMYVYGDWVWINELDLTGPYVKVTQGNTTEYLAYNDSSAWYDLSSKNTLAIVDGLYKAEVTIATGASAKVTTTADSTAYTASTDLYLKSGVVITIANTSTTDKIVVTVDDGTPITLAVGKSTTVTMGTTTDTVKIVVTTVPVATP